MRQKDLASCSLTCRAWVTSSRFRRFNGIAKLRPVIISPTSLPEILLLVDSPTSTISPYITSLVFKDLGPESHLPSSQSLSQALPPRITCRMVAVESLTFYATNWEDLADGVLKFLVYNCRDTLKTLELRECSCRDFGSLVDLTCSFRALENLSLNRIVRRSTSREERNSQPPSALLRSVQVHGYIKQELFRWLSAVKSLDIEDVTLGPLFPGEAPAVGKFLRLLKDNLKHLTISGESAPHLHRAIDLKHNGHLTSIHFSNLHIVTHRPDNYDWFIHLLLAIKSNQLQNIQFSLGVYSWHGVYALPFFPWDSLRTCLERPQFVCLTNVRFSLSMEKPRWRRRTWRAETFKIGEEFIRDQFPQYLEKETLSFEWTLPSNE